MFKLSSLSLAVLSALAFMPTVSVAADNTDATVLDEGYGNGYTFFPW